MPNPNAPQYRFIGTCLCILSTLVAAAGLAAPVPRDALWVSDGPVYASATNGDHSRLYLGGDFAYVGPATGAGLGVSADPALAATADPTFPRINGSVYAVIADGAGGWYVGGDFTEVGGVARHHLAHIDATKTVSAWDPDADAPIRAMALDAAGNTLYVGGDYTQIGGLPSLAYLAALDTATALATAWDPNADGPVYALALDAGANTLYVGGGFTTIGGFGRNQLAALDTTTAIASGWNPNADAPVRALVLAGGILYVGGDFTTIGGFGRNHLAALDTTTAVASGWNPNADAPVRVLALDAAGNKLYAGGDYTQIGGGNRGYLAALDTATALATAWAPDADGPVRALALDAGANTLYAGGDFTQIGGLARYRIAALDTSLPTENAYPVWDPVAGGSVYGLALGGGQLFVGGDFGSLGGVARAHLAALDLVSGAATGWDPGADDIVRTMVLSPDDLTLYIGGDFTATGGQARNYIAALDTVSAIPTSWNPNANNAVHAMAMDDSAASIFVGGTFTQIGGLLQQWLAELRVSTGTATFWDPDVDNGTGVYALALAGRLVYIGGDFLSVASTPRKRLAAIDYAALQVSTWAPGIDDGTVRALALSADGARLYVGGDFTSVAASALTGLAAIDTLTGVPLPWDSQTNGGVRALRLSLDRTTLFVGGDFTASGGTARSRLAALAVSDATALAGWDPVLSGPVQHLAIANHDPDYVLYVGGGFTRLDNASRVHLAALDVPPPETATPTTTAVPGAGSYNILTNQPIQLICDDGGGSGCAATYYTVDGSIPTTGSPLYTTPISLKEDTVLRYLSVDHMGNQESPGSAGYLIEIEVPETSASPPSQVFFSRHLSVQLSCDDKGGSGCAATYYTTDGSTPTTTSNFYNGPITIDSNRTIKFFSVDNFGNVESMRTASYVRNYGEIGGVTPPLLLALLAVFLVRTRWRCL